MTAKDFTLSRCLDDVDDDAQLFDFLQRMRARMAHLGLSEAAFDHGWIFKARRKDLFKYDAKTLAMSFSLQQLVRQETATEGLTQIADAGRLPTSRIKTTWIRTGGIFFRMLKDDEIVHVADKQATSHEVLDAQAGFMEAHPRMFER